ncbi:MAG TPA: 30S ribosomal protein S5 [Phycisphaerales bacterium]|nr:30S ribosomal protein S5 [Phycisphaerales bacterium]
MAELMEKSSQLETHTAGIFRTAATVKGGRRFSFGAMVIVGDRRGRAGYAHAKSQEVPAAIEKAEKHAKRNIISVPLVGGTIPHEIEGRFLATTVRLLPASPGTGVIAGSSVRSILELVGITDCMTKVYGSTNKINVIKAVFDALGRLRTKELIAELRGVEIESTDIEERIERAQRFMSSGSGGTSSGRVLTAEEVRLEKPEQKEEAKADEDNSTEAPTPEAESPNSDAENSSDKDEADKNES